MQTVETRTRAPCVAGLFYPDDSTRLRTQLGQFIETAESEGLAKGFRPRAIVAPHAGYVYSGAIAANAYDSIIQRAEDIKRVIVLGPSHQLAFDGAACPNATHLSTPLGVIDLDVEEINRLLAQGLIHINDPAHAREHSIEVQLPFLQYLLPKFKLLPIVVGLSDPLPIAAILESYWRADDALIVVSSDLSHYLEYDEARQVDADTSAAIEACRWQNIGPHQACGCYPLRGLLQLAQGENGKATCIDLRNSGDTAGEKSRVVGYGAYVFE